MRNGEFDERSGTLRCGAGTCHLDRSSRAILALLLDNAGAPVGKERLLEAGWPAIIVHENSLAKAIGRLREALGADADLLKAVYGVGYKLDAAILVLPPAPRRGSPLSFAPGKAPASKRRWAAALLAVVGLSVVIGLGFAFRSPESANQAQRQLSDAPPIIADAPDAIGKVLWVDDHPQNNIDEKQFFEKHRIAVHPVTTSDDALKLLAIYDYKAVITDMGRGEDRLAGARLVQQMRARNDRTPVVIYTVPADSATKQQAQRELAAEAGAQALAVTPAEVRSIVLDLFGNPPERAAD